MFRTLTRWYSRLLSWLLVASVAVLIIPVTLQIFSRYTELIPSYIWTEELARFCFIWSIMLGAMVGVREGTHFEVDLWPPTERRAPQAALRLVASAVRAGVRAGLPLVGHRVHALRAATASPSWPSCRCG